MLGIIMWWKKEFPIDLEKTLEAVCAEIYWKFLDWKVNAEKIIMLLLLQSSEEAYST